MIIVFDLDEVLYDEKTYVISGFRTVSEFLEKDEAIPKKIIFEYLKRRLKNCRERIFNDLLDNFSFIIYIIVPVYCYVCDWARI